MCASAPVASPRVRHLARAKRSQDINARVGENVPEAGSELNTKMRLSCEEIVIVAALLWKFLEIVVEIGGSWIEVPVGSRMTTGERWVLRLGVGKIGRHLAQDDTLFRI